MCQQQNTTKQHRYAHTSNITWAQSGEESNINNLTLHNAELSQN